MDKPNVGSDPVILAFLKHISGVKKRFSQIILFGSRARSDDKPSSDYDILLVTAQRDRELVDAVHDAVMDVLFATGRLVSPKIFRQADFERFCRIPTPFMKNVMAEGIPLG